MCILAQPPLGHVWGMTSRTTRLLATLSVVWLYGASSTGCAEAHLVDAGAGDAPSPVDAGAVDAARSCDLRPGPGGYDLDVTLVAEASNPSACAPSTACHVWFGHGTHLTCPFRDPDPSRLQVECTLGVYAAESDTYDRCVCVAREGNVVADFATGEAIDTRPGVPCRYRIVYE
jgi:hypothetical protein